MRRLLLLAACCAAAHGQTFSNSTLKGAYFVRHVQFTTDASNSVTDARSILGTLTFDGIGAYTFSGQQLIGTTAAASAFTASGAYSVSPGGFVTIANPQAPGLSISARYAVEAVVGAGTETPGTTFDLFVAIPAPPKPNFSNTILDSNFSVADFELTGASTSAVRDSFFSASLDGTGKIPAFSVTGHIAGINGGFLAQQSITGSTYSVNADGTGTIQFPLSTILVPSTSLLGIQQRSLFVSKTGNIFIAGNPASHDIAIGIKAITPPALNSNLTGRYWRAGVQVDTAGTSASFVGSATAVAQGLSFVTGRRVHSSVAGSTNAIYTNVSEAPRYSIAPAGTFSLGSTTFGLGQSNGMIVGATYSNVLGYSVYAIDFGVAVPAVSGVGVFVNPQGIVDAASFVPAGDTISPGEFIAINGSNLASAPAAASPPYAPSLGGVSVTINGLLAPIYSVSAAQINCLVPFGAAPAGTATANITVTSGGIASNTVTVPIAATSPGVFSLDQTGTGDGAILHADYSVVNSFSPAKKGDVVQLFLTGLGAPSTAVPDGQGATAADTVNAAVQVSVNGLPATVAYAGLSSLPGLYQINFTVPSSLTGAMPVTISTPDASTSQVTIFVQ